MPRFGLVLLLTVLTAPAGVLAQPVDATVFSLITLDATPRGAGLAGAVSASRSRDAGAFFYNPANLSARDHGRLSVGLLDHLSSLRTGTSTYTRSFDSLGTAAIGIRFMGWGDIPRTDVSGAQQGTFGAGEVAVTAAASRDVLPGLSVGLGLNWLRSSIDDRAASAVTLDAGVLLHRDASGFAVSLSLHHAGFVIRSIGSTADALPTDLRVGISKRLRHLPLLVSATAYGLFSGDGEGSGAVSTVMRHLLVGAEFRFSDAFQVRLGYDHRRHEALKIKSRLDFAGVSFGTGLQIRGVAFDYARTSWSSLGSVHRFGLSTRL